MARLRGRLSAATALTAVLLNVFLSASHSVVLIAEAVINLRPPDIARGLFEQFEHGSASAAAFVGIPKELLAGVDPRTADPDDLMIWRLSSRSSRARRRPAPSTRRGRSSRASSGVRCCWSRCGRAARRCSKRICPSKGNPVISRRSLRSSVLRGSRLRGPLAALCTAPASRCTASARLDP
jgi:hypothetical protein